MTLRLPAFPWDRLAPIAERAREHPDGVVDLSVGTPVDPTPDVVQRALCEASDSPGYPTTAGLPELRDACTQWLARRTAASDVGFLPTIGSKEIVAWLPTDRSTTPSGCSRARSAIGASVSQGKAGNRSVIRSPPDQASSLGGTFASNGASNDCPPSLAAPPGEPRSEKNSALAAV